MLHTDAAQNFLKHVKERALPDLVFGASRSTVCQPTALITGIYNLPQISPSCTSAKLDDTTNYPRFMRSVPTDDAVAFAICNYFDSKKFKFAGMLFVNEP